MYRRDRNQQPCFEALEERTLLSASLVPAPLDAPTESSSDAVSVDFASGTSYSNSNPPKGGLFRDVVGANNINWGQNYFAAGTRTTLNFNNGKAGTSGLTVYDTTPTNVTPTVFTGSIGLSVDVILGGAGSNAAGLVALLNENVGGKGIALVVRDNGNSDVLELHRINSSGVVSAANLLASVSLGNNIADGVYYRLTLDVAINGDAYTVTGKVFTHPHPDNAVGAQIGQTLTFSNSLQATYLTNNGEVGLIFSAGSAAGKGAFTHLAINPVDPGNSDPNNNNNNQNGGVGSDPAPTPTPGSVVVASLVAMTNGMELVVMGTNGDDLMTLSAISGGLSLATSAGAQSFMGNFTSVVVYGFAGNDTINLTSSVSASSVVYDGDGTDQIFVAGPGTSAIYVGAGNDLIVHVGGGPATISGGAGLDSFWVNSTDTVLNVNAAETAAKSVHKISSFLQPTNNPAQAVSTTIAGQNIVDPTADATYVNFASSPLFVNGPQYTDIIQGAVGDCYFVASLAAVAYADPTIINQMIAPLGDGSYAVRFYDGGQEVYVRVDADLPDYSGNSLYYAKLTPQGETWVALVEKAYAQYSGGNTYASINGGIRDTALFQITGDARNSISIQGTPDQIGNYIATNVAAGYAVTAGTDDHAYMVKSAVDVAGQWTVTVYNPWGFEQEMSMADFQALFVHGLTTCLV